MRVPHSQTPTTAGKAPAGKAPAEKKEAGKKTAAASGDKKKRTKTRRETYSSYIYKGMSLVVASSLRFISQLIQITFESLLTRHLQSSSRCTPTLVSPTAPCPS